MNRNMQRSIKTTGLIVATGLASLALLQPVWALDAEAFVERIEAVYATMGYSFEFGPARLEGDAVIVKGATVALPDTGPITLDTELTFSGVAETAEGGFTAESLTVPDIDSSFSSTPAGRVTVTNMRADDIWLPPADAISVEAGLQSLGSLSSGPLSVTRDGVEVLRLEHMAMTSEFIQDDDATLT